MKNLCKEFLKTKSLKISMMVCLAMSVMICAAFAVDDGGTTSSTVISAFETGFQQIKTDAFAILAVAAPVALSIAAVIFISRKAMAWFKSMAK